MTVVPQTGQVPLAIFMPGLRDRDLALEVPLLLALDAVAVVVSATMPSSSRSGALARTGADQLGRRA